MAGLSALRTLQSQAVCALAYHAVFMPSLGSVPLRGEYALGRGQRRPQGQRECFRGVKNVDEQLSKLPRPSPVNPVTADVVVSGEYIPPIERIRLFSPAQWEDFVLEWADSFREEYVMVERSGGAGDMGRDVVASCDESGDVWDNYQCKHYTSALAPSDVWIEFGKVVYYSHLEQFTYPRKYVFVAPQGTGNKLSKLLKKPDALKVGLKENWSKYCEHAISETASIPLDGELLRYLDAADFSIFSSLPPLRLIEQHSKTQWHRFRFGGSLPPRPAPAEPPSEIASVEVTYVRALLDAYGSRLKKALADIDELASETELRKHFARARREFYSAESLKLFSRDTLPPGEFERLQDEFFDGVVDEVESDHPDGFVRVKAVTKAARELQITSHALVPRIESRDRGGICHQLANDERVRWVK